MATSLPSLIFLVHACPIPSKPQLQAETCNYKWHHGLDCALKWEQCNPIHWHGLPTHSLTQPTSKCIVCAFACIYMYVCGWVSTCFARYTFNVNTVQLPGYADAKSIKSIHAALHDCHLTTDQHSSWCVRTSMCASMSEWLEQPSIACTVVQHKPATLQAYPVLLQTLHLVVAGHVYEIFPCQEGNMTS